MAPFWLINTISGILPRFCTPMIMQLRQTLIILFSGLLTQLAGQNDCSNPITINSVLISNTTCGNASGTIIVTPAGGGSAFTFGWTPSVSTSNVATNLAAGTYTVHIARANEPDCTLDTTIVVNNSNGPQVQVSVDPAECLASNGSATLSPASLLYNWSNGAGSNNPTALASGNYYVTATNPNTGCYSVLKVFVPSDFSFDLTANVLQQAKCSKNIGTAEIVVAQGSGQYSYSLGSSSVISGLAAGTYTCFVSDNVTGCHNSVSFTIEELPVAGNVAVTPHNVRCFGVGNGLVEFTVTPGANFELPYTFTLKNAAGVGQTPGNLAAGTYYLQVFDADLCPLQPDTFSISEPAPIAAQPVATPETCQAGGTISLTISGGTGTVYNVDWLDLPGNINPKKRTNLHAGLYSAIIADSLFCTQNINNVLVAPQCNGSDTAFMVVKTSSTDFFCWEQPTGLAAGATTYTIIGGGLTGSSGDGAWFLNTDGCLAYSAGPNPGFAVDTICMVRTASQIGLKDTLCLIVTITAKQPSKQSVFFTVQTQSASAACGSIPATFSNYTIVQLGRPGLNGASDVYGNYSISDTSACLSFFANNTTGFSVDEIRVAVCDTVLNECHIICYLPSIIQAVDCSSVISLADTLEMITTDCEGLAYGCVPIPYDDIVNYAIIDNGVLYNTGYLGCDPHTTISYNVAILPPGGGPYQISEWLVNGQPLTGAFSNLAGLVAQMNQLDPNPGWVLQGSNYIRGGNTLNNYGSLRIKSIGNLQATYDPSIQQVAAGTELRFKPGIHSVIFRNVLNACADTLIVNSICHECLPIHPYALDAFGNVKWDTKDGCLSDTVFCTNILQNDLPQYVITDNEQPVTGFVNCGNFVGLQLDTGYHQLHFVNTVTTCAYYVRFYLDCRNNAPGDSLHVTLGVGEQTTLCLDTTLLTPPIVSIINLCEDDGGSTVVGYAYDEQHWCATLVGLGLGVDTLCLQLCNANGQCANYIVSVLVTGATSDSLQAVDDAVFTLAGDDVDIPIFANDIINGIAGNRFALAGYDIITQPHLGYYTINQATGVLTYSPDALSCGVDSFTYRIVDSLGQQSIATIKITIVCDKVLVFNGISPNGDGKNDKWHILGIDQYPGNEIHVFNRWGNQVYEQKGYTNANAWDGTWNGKDLPDGTYFYIINLGGSNGNLEGYLQILR